MRTIKERAEAAAKKIGSLWTEQIIAAEFEDSARCCCATECDAQETRRALEKTEREGGEK